MSITPQKKWHKLPSDRFYSFASTILAHSCLSNFSIYACDDDDDGTFLPQNGELQTIFACKDWAFGLCFLYIIIMTSSLFTN